MKTYLQRIDTATSGRRYDVTPIFADASDFGRLVEDLAAPFLDVPPDVVACIDALGFILGTAIATRLGVGVVPLRKGDKLPVDTDAREFRDYSGTTKQLEVRMNAFSPDARVLLVDEWIETGAQVTAALELIEAQGGTVIGIASINIDKNERTAALHKRYRIRTVWDAEQMAAEGSASGTPEP